MAHTTRSWNDSFYGAGDPRTGNYVPDCDLTSSITNGECGPYDNRNFGTAVITNKYATDVTEGYGVRPNNQQISAVVQHELQPGFGVTVGYYRTWYGNKTVTDNLLVTPADFTAFCVTAPADSRLPDGGGYQVCDPTDVNPTSFGRVDNLIIRAEEGEQTEVFNGIDIGMNARFGRGGRLNGGVSFGNTDYNNCGVPDASAQFCEYSMPWSGQTQIKFQGYHPLPLGSMSRPRTSARLAFRRRPRDRTRTPKSSLRSAGRSRAVPRRKPSRFSSPTRSSRIGTTRSIFASAGRSGFRGCGSIPGSTSTTSPTRRPSSAPSRGYGAAWLRPTEILTARLIKFGAQIDW